LGLLRSFVITIVDVGERGGREREGERDGDLGRERDGERDGDLGREMEI
jgi:hypothetical protein